MVTLGRFSWPIFFADFRHRLTRATAKMTKPTF
jgi:hypothetical protein